MFLGNDTCIVKTRNGMKLFLDCRDLSLTPHLCTDLAWEIGNTRFIIDYIRPGMNCCDIGSNIGYFSTIIASMITDSGHLYCFEPNKRAFDLLKKNLEINGYRKRVSLTNKLVTNESTIKAFHILEDHKISSSCMPLEELKKIEGGLYEKEYVTSIPTLTCSLDETIPAGTRIDFMKVDAEGCEDHVIIGAKRILDENPNMDMMLELCPDYIRKAGGDPHRMCDELLRRGYKPYGIGMNGQLSRTTFSEALDKNYSELFLSKK